MQQIKIIFFDIDGTLIDMQSKHISPRTVEALHRLRANGIRLCIATGRAPVTLPDFGGAEFDAYLTFNGSLCYAGADTIYSRPINGADLQRLIQNAASLGRPVAAATRERIAANGTDTDLADYFAIANEKPDLTADFDAVCRQPVYQLMLGCRAKDYPAILQGVSGLRSQPGGTVRWMSSRPMAARASVSKRCWPTMVLTKVRRLPSVMATMTWKCWTRSAPAWRWRMPPPSSRRWPMQYAQAWRRMVSGNTAQPMG